MAYKPKVKTVSEGGTGAPTLTGVLTGNGTGTITASTVTNHGVVVAGASNSVSTVAPGTSGNVLTSNGTSWTSAAAPAGSSGYILAIRNIGSAIPSDATTYFMGIGFFTSFVASGQPTRIYIPKTGTINRSYGNFAIASTLGTTENCTFIIRLNNTTDTTLSSTFQLTAADVPFNFTGLSLAVSAGDYIEFKFVCPTWVTNPSGVTFEGNVLIT